MFRVFPFSLSYRSGRHLYCSETTKNLLTLTTATEHLAEYVIGIPVSQPTLLTFEYEDNEEIGSMLQQQVLVTLLPAGHCVGSVMFLFQGSNKTVLYTGDFRLTKDEIQKIPQFQTGDSVIQLNSMYVDTTFCSPKSLHFPSREETKNAMIKIIASVLKQGKLSMIHINCSAKYGYEYILMGIAEHFKTKIHIDKFKMRLYSALPNANHYFTSNEHTCQIHSCYIKQDDCCSSDLPCGLTHVDGMPVKVTRIKPSTMYFAMKGEIPESYTTCNEFSDSWRVVHSMHASMNEICGLANYLKPKYVYPIVTPFDSKTIVSAYERLKKFTSCDIDYLTASQNSTKQAPRIKKSPDKDNWKTSFCKEPINSPVRVSNLHKSLGLNTDIDFVPPSRRRKAAGDIKCKENKLQHVECPSSDHSTESTASSQYTASSIEWISSSSPYVESDITKIEEQVRKTEDEKIYQFDNSNVESSIVTQEERTINDSEETYFSPAEDSQNPLNYIDCFDIPGSPDYEQPNSQDLKDLHEKVKYGLVKHPPMKEKNFELFLTLKALERIE